MHFIGRTLLWEDTVHLSELLISLLRAPLLEDDRSVCHRHSLTALRLRMKSAGRFHLAQPQDHCCCRSLSWYDTEALGRHPWVLFLSIGGDQGMNASPRSPAQLLGPPGSWGLEAGPEQSPRVRGRSSSNPGYLQTSQSRQEVASVSST